MQTADTRSSPRQPSVVAFIQEDLMTTLDATAARKQFAELLNRAACDEERIVLTNQGKALAAIVPIEDVQLLEELEDRIDIEDARAALAEAQEKGTIPLEQLRAELLCLA
jgi:prevent-host-death family protein